MLWQFGNCIICIIGKLAKLWSCKNLPEEKKLTHPNQTLNHGVYEMHTLHICRDGHAIALFSVAIELLCAKLLFYQHVLVPHNTLYIVQYISLKNVINEAFLFLANPMASGQTPLLPVYACKVLRHRASYSLSAR